MNRSSEDFAGAAGQKQGLCGGQKRRRGQFFLLDYKRDVRDFTETENWLALEGNSTLKSYRPRDRHYFQF